MMSATAASAYIQFSHGCVMSTHIAYERGSKGGFIHASRAAGSILLSTSYI